MSGMCNNSPGWRNIMRKVPEALTTSEKLKDRVWLQLSERETRHFHGAYMPCVHLRSSSHPVPPGLGPPRPPPPIWYSRWFLCFVHNYPFSHCQFLSYHSPPIQAPGTVSCVLICGNLNCYDSEKHPVVYKNMLLSSGWLWASCSWSQNSLFFKW